MMGKYEKLETFPQEGESGCTWIFTRNQQSGVNIPSNSKLRGKYSSCNSTVRDIYFRRIPQSGMNIPLKSAARINLPAKSAARGWIFPLSQQSGIDIFSKSRSGVDISVYSTIRDRYIVKKGLNIQLKSTVRNESTLQINSSEINIPSKSTVRG